MRFEMITRPGVPNVNGVTYSKECWNKFLNSTNLEEYKIPVTDIDYNIDDNILSDISAGIPPQNLLGFVSNFEDNSVVFDPIVNPDIDKKLKQYEIEGRKAFMRYLGTVNNINGEMVVMDIAEIISIDIEPVWLGGKNEKEGGMIISVNVPNITEIPKICGKCPFSYYDHYFENDPPLKCNFVYCGAGLDPLSKHKDCPIIDTD